MSNKAKFLNYIILSLFLLTFILQIKKGFPSPTENNNLAGKTPYTISYYRTPTPRYKMSPTCTPSPTPTPTPIEKVIDMHIFDPQWVRLELLYGKNPQSPFAFFNINKSERTMAMLIKTLRKIMYEEVHNTYCSPFITAGSFYDTRTGKSVGKLISKYEVLTNGIDPGTGYNLIWDEGKVYILSNKRLNDFFTLNGRWPYTSIGGLALLLPYFEKRQISSEKSIYRTGYGLRQDGMVILIQYEGTIKGMQRAMSYYGAVTAVQVDSGSQGICIMNSRAPYYYGGKMKSIIMGIPSFHLYKPEPGIRS